MDLGFDSSVQETLYAIDWDDHEVGRLCHHVLPSLLDDAR